MAKHRTHSLEFKRQVAQEFLAGETLHGLAKRYALSRNLIRIWVQRFEAGVLDEDAVAADLIEQYEARIAALERLVGKQALELEFVKGALKSAPRRKDAPTSVIVGPPAYVPLTFAPGEAYQFDWSREIAVLDGVTTIVKVAHVRLCHSRMMFVRAYPREAQEMVFDAQERAFAFFKGACGRCIYDNMKTAVETILVGKDRCMVFDREKSMRHDDKDAPANPQ